VLTSQEKTDHNVGATRANGDTNLSTHAVDKTTTMMVMVDVAAMVAVDASMGAVVAVVVVAVASTTLAPPAQPRKDCVLPLVLMYLFIGRRLLEIRRRLYGKSLCNMLAQQTTVKISATSYRTNKLSPFLSPLTVLPS